MISLLKYKKDSYNNRIVFDDGKIISAIYSNENEVNKGDLYLGEVVSKSINGYFVNLGRFNAYTNDTDLIIGKNYVFEIIKNLDDKKPLVTSNYSLQSNSFILNDTLKFSSNIDNENRLRLEKLGINVFFKTEAMFYSNSELLFEYNNLISAREKIEKIALYEKGLKKIYSVEFIELKEDILIREYEEKKQRFKKEKIFFDNIQINVEKTKVGTIIDVDSLSNKNEISKINFIASNKITEIIKILNLSGIIIIDFIGSGIGVDKDLFLTDNRITYLKVSKNGICEIIRKNLGFSLI